MTTPLRLLAIFFIFVLSLIAWMALGAIIGDRSRTEAARLTQGVEELWGQPLSQSDPDASLRWTTMKEVSTETRFPGGPRTEMVPDAHVLQLPPEQTEASVSLVLDQRQKGLIWYSLYDAVFDGRWTFTNKTSETSNKSSETSNKPSETKSLHLFIEMPDANAMYDDFHFEVDGKDLAQTLDIDQRARGKDLPLAAGQTVQLHVHYRTRGMDRFSYAPTHANSLTRFHFRATTNFAAIDYPAGATSPTNKQREGSGWQLDWTFAQVLSGKPMGVVMPAHLQPGELAQSLSFSAPVSLFFFFLILLALAALRGLDIHPINYFAIAGAFFAFQLLFAYSVDRLPLWVAFTLSSGASIGLVVSYLRLVVDAKFALREAALAQLVYQVGFALAHFWEGYTGLTVSVLATLTLFLVMQLTGRLRWSEVLRTAPKPQPAPHAAAS